ncbi:hypothetical protein BCR43DRAFT_513735 [Syncephalastrum racemosum]|uniref:Uncharacterized protein n=1 Tax=Syncephalastrum racemosum TaxID=13706 RepID=A0A1X2HEG5_SYNRA|nr:hypothetical protein BCR43DRAFT_513735 [Syncephalastrum racemosum]
MPTSYDTFLFAGPLSWEAFTGSDGSTSRKGTSHKTFDPEDSMYFIPDRDQWNTELTEAVSFDVHLHAVDILQLALLHGAFLSGQRWRLIGGSDKAGYLARIFRPESCDPSTRRSKYGVLVICKEDTSAFSESNVENPFIDRPNYLLKEEAFFLLYAEYSDTDSDEMTVYAHLTKDKCSYPIVRPDWRPALRSEIKVDVETQYNTRVQQAIDVQSQIQEEEAKKREEAVAQERERRRQTTRSYPQVRSQNMNTMTKMSLSSLSSRASQGKTSRSERPRAASRSLSMPYTKMRSSQQASQTNDDLVLDDASFDLSTQDVEVTNKKELKMTIENELSKEVFNINDPDNQRMIQVVYASCKLALRHKMKTEVIEARRMQAVAKLALESQHKLDRFAQ